MPFPVLMAGALAANLGAIEVLDPSGGHVSHLGFYPYIGVSMIVPGPRITFIPALSVEWSPDAGRWGFVAAGTGDLALSPRLGFDINVSLIHDQAGAGFGDAIFLIGGGPGVSIFLGRYTLSPYVSVFKGLNVSGWSVVPGLNAAMSL